jgi:hypothetical protein
MLLKAMLLRATSLRISTLPLLGPGQLAFDGARV